MENCSVITATYSIGEEQTGSIAIIGPTRMDYKRVVSLLDIMSGDLSREFRNYYMDIMDKGELQTCQKNKEEIVEDSVVDSKKKQSKKIC